MSKDKDKDMKIPVGAIISTAIDVVSSDKMRKTLFGTYSNGKSRNLTDAIHNEVVSPEDKLKITKRIKKNKKKKKKNKKYGKINLFED